MSKQICIGKITGVHGVKGFVKIKPYCEDVSLIEHANNFEITIKSITHKHILASVKGVQDRDDADAIKGQDITIDRNALPEIDDDDSYYYEDLKGLAVHTKDNKEFGHIKSVHNFGASDLLEITPKNGKAFLLPFHDDFVPEVGDDFVLIQDFEEFMDDGK